MSADYFAVFASEIRQLTGAEGDNPRLGGYTTWRARTSCLEELAEPKIKAAVVGLLVEVASSEL